MQSDTKLCRKCKTTKRVSDFYATSAVCKQCNKQYRAERWHYTAYNHIRERERNGRVPKVETPVTAEEILEMYIDIDGVCPSCQTHTYPHTGSNSPSIDRIDNSKGYSPENVWILCNSCNRRKGDSRSPHDLYIIADSWYEKIKELEYNRSTHD